MLIGKEKTDKIADTVEKGVNTAVDAANNPDYVLQNTAGLRSSAAGMEMHIRDEVEAAPTGIIGRKTPSNFTPI